MPIVCQKSVNKGTGDRLFLDNNNYLVHSYTTLSEKQSEFPRYNMKSRGKRDTMYTLNIPRSITLSPLHFMLYRGKSITFGTVLDRMNVPQMHLTLGQLFTICC